MSFTELLFALDLQGVLAKMQAERKGCLQNAYVWVGFIAALVTILAESDKFTQALTSASSGIGDTIVKIAGWLTGPMELPRFIFGILIFFTLLSIVRVLQSAFRRQHLRRVNFRDLWLFVTPSSNGLTRVVNDKVEEARCGKCLGRIVSTDAGSSGGRIRYLKCENGHFVGNKVSFEDYQKEQKEMIRKMEGASRMGQIAAAEAHEQLRKDLEDGKITQEEFNARLLEPPQSRVPLFARGDIETQPPYSAQEFYSRLVSDFEDECVRKALEKIEPLSGAKQQINH